jgi:hypothetical protein
MSLTKTTYSMINGAPFNVLDYGAKGDGTTDDTAAIQATINAAQLITGSTYITATHCNTVYIPAGVYKITATINILGNVNFIGDGNNATIFNMVSATPIQSFLIGPSSDNQYVWGSSFKGFRINCDGGASVCDGFKLQTGNVNSVITQTEFDDILVFNCRTGFELSGVLYMLDFRNCKVVGTTSRGFVTTGAKEIIYNNFTNIEVTNVANNALAFFMNSAASQYTNITADGCCKFGGAYTGISGLSVEGISATTPFSTTCIEFNQISSAKDIAIIDVPTAKCSLGISVIGNSTNIGPVRFPDAGVANQPATAIYYGSTATGFLTSVQMSNCANKIQSGAGGLGNVTAISCGDIVSRQFTAWTPGYATWTTAPTAISAFYTRVGSQVTVNILAQGGVCNAGSTITGLPVISSSSAGGGGSAQNVTDTTKGFRCAILSGSTSIVGVPVTSFGASDYWSLTATYFTESPV